MRRKLTRFLVSMLLAILATTLLPRFAALPIMAQGDSSTQEEVTSPEEQPASPAQGTVIAALEGYSVETNGFGFANYGSKEGYTNLTATEMQRMFGDAACASKADGGCTLTGPAEKWMKEINGVMNGGHCEGMAVLSLLLYDQNEATSFAGQKAGALKLDDEALQREIAYWFATQSAPPTFVSDMQKITPSQVLQQLEDSFKPDSKELYTLGIFKPGHEGGHAITPYAIEDLGNEKFAVLNYDNNHPQTVRRLIIDKKNDTWQYNASINPNEEEDLYQGNARTNTLSLTRMPPRLEKPKNANFFKNDESGTNTGSGAAKKYNELWMEGEGQLLITDDQGR